MNLSALIGCLDDSCRDALENAAAACLSRGGYEIGIEDYMEQILPLAEMQDILIQFERNGDRIAELLEKRLQRAGGKNITARPVFSPLLVEFLQEAYLIASLEMHTLQLTIGTLILTLLRNPIRYAVMPFFQELEAISPEKLKNLLEGLQENSGQAQTPSVGKSKGESFLQKYTVDFTEEARKNNIDPVFARGPEIRQIVDTLTRRRKNNPILVGDPGVGKTAVVEGLALKIIKNDVPDALKNVRLVGLDMGNLQAGASVKGEFEKRLKGVINEVKASPVPTILFIDEAHTLIGSGNAAGSSDGANLLKPALARGELRTIAATTWSEYKKYFEKDAALARRFQLIKLDEPSIGETITILRGIVPNYEATHKVYIRDDAVVRTAELASRYISGRFLPDKAIDVLDTACARVRVSMGAKPSLLENIEEELASIERECCALERDHDHGSMLHADEIDAEHHASLLAQKTELKQQITTLTEHWQQEQQLVDTILQLRAQMHVADSNTKPKKQNIPPKENEDAVPQKATSASVAPPSIKKQLEKQIIALQNMQGDAPLVFYEVCPLLISTVIAEFTGIPIGKLGEDETDLLKNFSSHLQKRIKGQDHALRCIEKSVLASKTGLNSPTAPTGIFLLVGPSGVGKTETALAVADTLFGGEHMLVSINMSEFQEKHTISRLIGSPPGYIGYGEGGRLTEAVRRQPYSAVLFDEVEKAHPDVLNLFYQMFDKGTLADGEGREIDFRSTIIFMTSNLGSDITAALFEDEEIPDAATLLEAIRPALVHFFKPALLGRMTIVPYNTMQPEILQELAQMKLQKIADQIAHKHHLTVTWSKNVSQSIAASCTAVDTGARNIDHIITASLLPMLGTTLLELLSSKDQRKPSGLRIELEPETNNFTLTLV